MTLLRVMVMFWGMIMVLDGVMRLVRVMVVWVVPERAKVAMVVGKIDVLALNVDEFIVNVVGKTI